MKSLTYMMKVSTFIFLLVIFIYSGFFLEKGKFFNNTGLEIETTELDIINTKTTINAIMHKLERLKSSQDATSPQIQEQMKRLEDEHDIYFEKYNNLDYKIGLLDEKEKERSKNGHYDNIYNLIRALSLGALGAMLTLITSSRFLIVKKGYNYQSLFIDSTYWDQLISSSLSGALVSIVVFSMFYSNQLSVFPLKLDNEVVEPDFWRTTLVCLIAGAFSEKIYQALSGKLQRYTDELDTHTSQINKD